MMSFNSVADILHWTWEQFASLLMNASSLLNAEILVYLQQALKGRSIRNSIDGLCQSGENDEEEVECLKS